LATQNYIDQVNRYWVETYNIDGFRFDYTKGFINNGNAYSMDRINLLKRMADEIWAYKPNAYVILEHWCDNAEEEQLADHGMMLWGNVTHGYQQALMGFTNSSNISSGIYTNRGWSVPHLISYAESHDEERTMFEALTYGNNTNATHNARNLYTALGRAQGLAVILLTQPGPKMLWQFQELGYDISIDNPCRVCNKPILWNYYTQARRRQLYDVYAATLALRNNYETFRSLTFQYSLTGAVKRVNMNHSSMNGVSMANFAVSTQSLIPAFQHAGWWYEYFTGDSINVTNALAPISLSAGEYRIYTDVKLAQPEITDAPVSIEEVLNSTFELKVYPNPSSQMATISFQSIAIEPFSILLLNEAGQIVLQKKGSTSVGKNEIQLNVNELSSGNYHFLVKVGAAMANQGFVKVN
jgi:pullulanase/glycogen debranching enzyme